MTPQRLKWLLPLAFAVVYILPLGLRPLWIPDEARYAEISREMVETGDWFSPRLLGLRYFEKPAGGYWLNSLSFLVFGENNFALRLPTALAAGLSALFVALLALRGTSDGLKSSAAALVYLSSPMVLGIGTIALPDSMLSCCLAAGLASFWWAYSSETPRWRLFWWTLFGACCGAAFLIKGFVALAISACSVVPFMLWQRRWAELFIYGCMAVLAAVLVTLPWSVVINAQEPDFWHYFFWEEHIRRFSGSDAQHPRQFWYYLPFVVLMAVPWVGAVPAAIRSGWESSVRTREAFSRYALLSLAMPVLFLSMSNGKAAPYILPCCAPLAILIGNSLIDAIDRGRTLSFRTSTWCCITIGAIALASLVILQVFVDKYAYTDGEMWKLALAGLCAAAWLTVAVLTLRRRIPYLAGLALLPATMVPAMSLAWPRSLEYTKMPETFLEKQRNRIEPGAALASSNIGLSFAVAWELHRSDIFVVGGRSELDYGLSYADAGGRYVPLADLAAWVRDVRTRRPVALFVREDRRRPVGGYPPADWSATEGNLALLYYNQQR